jgi:hypothetical protein
MWDSTNNHANKRTRKRGAPSSLSGTPSSKNASIASSLALSDISYEEGDISQNGNALVVARS